MKLFLAVIVVLTISGCATTHQDPSSTRTSEPIIVVEQPVIKEAEEKLPQAPVLAREVEQVDAELPAVTYLLDLAQEALEEENYERTNALADRALKIERKTARAYLILAQSQYNQGSVQKANALAKQGLLYTSDSSDTGRALRKLIY